MNNSLAYLKPISGVHSIKEAVLVLFLASKIIKPNEYECLITKNEVIKKDFQRFEPQSTTHVKIEGTHINIQQEENAGFAFTSFNKGKPDKLLRGINQENRFLYSFHLFDYKNWQTFKDDFVKYIDILGDHQPGAYVQAYGLTYLDEFTWDNDSNEKNEFSAELVFNEKSDYLPKHFFEPKNVTYSMTSGSESSDKNNKYSNRIDIVITDKLLAKSIAISHNQTIMLPSVVELKELINSAEFNRELNSIHDENKNVLKNLLTDGVCRKINII